MDEVDLLEVSIHDFCWLRVVAMMPCCGGCDYCKILCFIDNVCGGRGIIPISNSGGRGHDSRNRVHWRKLDDLEIILRGGIPRVVVHGRGWL